MFRGTRKSRSAVVFVTLAILAIAFPMLSQAANGLPSRNAQMLGAEDPSKQITVAFWLKQHDKARLDELVRQMYDRNSPNYHHWLTLKEYQARFAPSGKDMAAVKQYLAAHNLRAVLTDKLNLAVTARGTVADVERATGVQLNRALINGKQRRVAVGTPVLSGAAGKLVYTVEGLTDTRYQNHVARQINPDTGKPFPAVKVSKRAKAQEAQQEYWDYCMRDTWNVTFGNSTNGNPYSTYTGTKYGGPIRQGPPHLAPCGYNAPDMASAYGLNALYSQGLDGTGQTVAIVDAYGSDTIWDDANYFAQINGLPAYTDSNFTIYYPTGPTNCGGNTCGWDVETSLDVEWAHAVAPGANIALVLAADNSSTNLDLAVLYAIETQLSPVVSNSWGIPESELIAGDPAELTVENNLNETGAALGISTNYSSGDSGDFLIAEGVITVNMPSASPYATSIGGTSLFLKHDHSMKTQTGWGTNLARISTFGHQPIIPPTFLGFAFGAGGGASAWWSKPSYQGSLPGDWRLLPDISYDADPYTGAEVIDTEINGPYISVIGGTSLACPMFSAMWTIATQAAGRLLGQAAPTLYSLPAGAITDVTNVNGPANVSGFTDVPPNPPTNYSSADLLAPVQTSTDFIGMLYQGITTRWYAISFGTDSSLTTGPGWDNVTGLGTPNGMSFVQAVAAAK